MTAGGVRFLIYVSRAAVGRVRSWFSWDGNRLRKRVVGLIGFSEAVDIIGNYGDRVRAAGDGVCPPPEPMVTDAPAARGPTTQLLVTSTPSTKYETPTDTPAGVAAVPWFFTTLVKRPVALEYESEVTMRSGRCLGMEIIFATAGTPDVVEYKKHIIARRG